MSGYASLFERRVGARWQAISTNSPVNYKVDVPTEARNLVKYANIPTIIDGATILGTATKSTAPVIVTYQENYYQWIINLKEKYGLTTIICIFLIAVLVLYLLWSWFARKNNYDDDDDYDYNYNRDYDDNKKKNIKNNSGAEYNDDKFIPDRFKAVDKESRKLHRASLRS